MSAQTLGLEHYLTTSEAARRLGVSEATLRNWSSKGLVPAIVSPHGRLFADEDIARLRAQRTEVQHAARD